VGHLVRLTEFTAARPADRDALADFVRDGQQILRAAPACATCDTYFDLADPTKIVAIEVWTQQGARDVAAAGIPANLVRGAMALMSDAPHGRDLAQVQPPAGSAADNAPLRLAVVVASVRQERMGAAVADWFLSLARADTRYAVDVIDLAETELPASLPADPADLSDPSKRPASLAHCTRLLAMADAIAFVSPEYNHGMPASLKHFIDWHFTEWRGKPVGCVGYGGLAGGVRAIENIRLVMAELHACVIRDTVTLNAPWDYFDADGALAPPAATGTAAGVLLGRLHWWGSALRTARLLRPYDG
jgi:NAD(P)H-dependent FMN reductase